MREIKYCSLIANSIAVVLVASSPCGMACEIDISGVVAGTVIGISCKIPDLCKQKFVTRSGDNSFEGFVGARTEKKPYVLKGEISKNNPILFDGRIEYKIPDNGKCNYTASVKISINVSPVRRTDDLTYYVPQLADVGEITVSIK